MKSYKTISHEEATNIINGAYPHLVSFFLDAECVPNNWLRMHGYSMHKRGMAKRCEWVEYHLGNAREGR